MNDDASTRPPLRIRTRLTLAVVIVLLVTLFLSGVILIRGTRATLVDQIDEQVRAYATRSEGRFLSWFRYGGDNGIRSSAEVDIFGRPVARLLYSADWTLLVAVPSGFPDDPDPLPVLSSLGNLRQRDGRIVTLSSEDGSVRYRALLQQGPDGMIGITAVPLTRVDATLARLVRLLIILDALALLAAATASWLLIRRGLRPVDRMVQTASTIAAGNLSQRVVDSDPRTELGQLGQALNDMLHQIDRAVQARAASESRLRRFVADAAHELRTPLTSLRGYAELYRKGALPDEESVSMAMERIESEGARMARLVDDMLLLARLDQQRGLEMKPEDVSTIVADAISAFRAVDPGRPVSANLQPGIIVLGDRFRLRQVVDNLLTNTRVHTPAGTPVHASVSRDGGMAVITIADEGPGIGKEDQERIFDRFWRGGPARLRSGAGTGLGLSIAASLIEAHGGTIQVQSDPGQGVTFTVRVPLAQNVG